MDKYMLGLQLLVIGMGTVILSLFLLSLFLRFSGQYLGADSNKQETKKTGTRNMDQGQSEGIDIKDEKSNGEIDRRKAAAITAAVYEYLDDSKEYRVISIKKDTNNWKR